MTLPLALQSACRIPDDAKAVLAHAHELRMTTTLTWREIYQRSGAREHYAHHESLSRALYEQGLGKRPRRPETWAERLARLERQIGYHAAADRVCTYAAGY